MVSSAGKGDCISVDLLIDEFQCDGCPLMVLRRKSSIGTWYHSFSQSLSGILNPLSGSTTSQCSTISFQDLLFGLVALFGRVTGTQGITRPAVGRDWEVVFLDGVVFLVTHYLPNHLQHDLKWTRGLMPSKCLIHVVFRHCHRVSPISTLCTCSMLDR